ncbi:PAS domain S-box-containing protein/diguanylate cyclase (GGDEF) domain-containing protein [Pseudidiomarina planktonica]|uniref:PAS domain S-box-containing protein/diguanylate cyclase (GGDEF) domain-containing protein n=1 Tax=Pseudidiomarina planktonica TaxID=1323738 RepID=A0A1Y6EDB3_9GAMM|nr:diguanylate cyclase [Pseudidiomarina planktonica]RUO66354.1 hypothetical protein CWI77_08005 [Pseudidiomarina planktonica]SMQ58612.1 PAS domain S-box-containing protein/diguanylate cyclase (GGDEF) domain-containing protein [Pseudidiomarina planktonica]
MTPVKIPMNEAERLAALKSLQILDTPAEKRFDRLARLAAHILDAPIALISLVDENRLWFKAHFGMDVCEAPRKFSFCSHALDSYSPFIVKDAAQDPRFTNNLYVSGAPGVRFYIGIPLRGPGDHIVGTLCVLDTSTREIVTSDIDALQDVAKIVEGQLRHVELESVSAELQRSNQKLAAIILASPLAIITCDLNQHIDVWNSSAETLIGVTANNAAGKQLADISQALSDKLFEMSQQISKGGIVRDELFDIRLANGCHRHLDLSVAPLNGLDGQQNGFTLVIVDVTEREHLLQNSEHEHQLLEAVLNNLDAGVAACDESGTLTFFNRAAREYLGEPIKSGAEEWAQHYQVYDGAGEQLLKAEELPLYRAWMGETLKNVELIVRLTGKPERTFIANGSAYGSESAKHGGAVVVFHDISAQKKLEHDLKHQATHDSLTGLPNRGALMEVLAGAIARAERSGNVSALFFLDLDGFKNINDTYGHQVGDEVLKTVANRIKGAVRAADAVARLSGDEFVIVAEQLKDPKEDCKVITNTVLKSITAPLAIGHGLVLTTSIGVALHRGNCNADELLKLADAAMYKAKREGARKVCVDDSYL